MNTTLILTVGGSFRPLVRSAQELEPDRVVFLVTDRSKGQVDGPGKPCTEIDRETGVEQKFPNLVTQMALGDRFEETRDVKTVAADDIAQVYETAAGVIKEAQASGDTVLADYTGGTKSMSVGLAMAAVDAEAAVYVTTGPRTDLLKVHHNEVTELASGGRIRVERTLRDTVPKLLRSFNYSGALVELKALLKGTATTQELRGPLRNLILWCQAFEEWDRFDHQSARITLKPILRFPAPLQRDQVLTRICLSRDCLDATEGSPKPGKAFHGYEALEDLLLNAERRAQAERFDDAVGRLYRALELLAQLRWRLEYQQGTSSLDLSRLQPGVLDGLDVAVDANLRSSALGLVASYRALTNIDPLFGPLWEAHGGGIENALQVRNASLFAHGFRPIDRQSWRDFSKPVRGFIDEVTAKLNHHKGRLEPLKQLPNKLDADLERALGS